jgi:hypothetical protein
MAAAAISECSLPNRRARVVGRDFVARSMVSGRFFGKMRGPAALIVNINDHDANNQLELSTATPYS